MNFYILFESLEETSGDFAFKIWYNNVSGFGEAEPTKVTYEEDPRDPSTVTPDPVEEETTTDTTDPTDTTDETTDTTDATDNTNTGEATNSGGDIDPDDNETETIGGIEDDTTEGETLPEDGDVNNNTSSNENDLNEVESITGNDDSVTETTDADE